MSHSINCHNNSNFPFRNGLNKSYDIVLSTISNFKFIGTINIRTKLIVSHMRESVPESLIIAVQSVLVLKE